MPSCLRPSTTVPATRESLGKKVAPIMPVAGRRGGLLNALLAPQSEQTCFLPCESLAGRIQICVQASTFDILRSNRKDDNYYDRSGYSVRV